MFQATQPSTTSDSQWAQAVMREALRRMQTHCAESGRRDLWEVFERRLLQPMLEGAEPLPYEQLVEQFQFESPAQVYNALTTGKRMFIGALRLVIAEYARDEREIDAEIEEWKAILSCTS
jgi:hypothetical protein